MSVRDRLRQALGGGVPTIDASTAHRLVEEGALLLDVREPSEWNLGHAPQAQHVPLGRLSPEDPQLARDRTIVVVCRSGNRSRSATQLLLQSGHDAVNLGGGMLAWRAEGLPVIGRGGRPGDIG